MPGCSLRAVGIAEGLVHKVKVAHQLEGRIMGDDVVKKLELRVVELEDQLKQQRARPQPSDITAEEVKAYLRVREMLAVDWGDNCGINECQRCIARCGTCIRWPSETISRCVHLCACIVECTCGPCNFGGFGAGGVTRFSGLGG